MKHTWLVTVTALLGAVMLACSDDGVSPLAPHQTVAVASKGTTKSKVAAPEWQKKLKSDVSASQVIGPEGGVLELPETGLRVVVPAGAVSQPTRFGVTALAGKLVAYDFQPAGARFAVPLQVTQDLSFFKSKSRPDSGSVLRAGYFESTADLDQENDQVTVVELMKATVTNDSLTYQVSHFSGYIICWGFQYDGCGCDEF